MSDDVTGTTTHQQLISLLTEQEAHFRVVAHEAVGKCEAVSEIRGPISAREQKRWSVR